ncbi:MAG: sugar ABC transporter permease [Ruminococcaceae bacterium]|nr:sugar ABC transporter permease [Oscillospiraceae bacterium]
MAKAQTKTLDTGVTPLKIRLKKYRVLYLMLIPGALWFILFHILPLYGITIAFQDFNVIKGITGSRFVGLDNFKSFVLSASFTKILGNTVKISALKILFGFPLPIVFALCLNEIKAVKFKKITQTISYLPYFLSWVIVMGICQIVFSDYTGVFKGVFEALGLQYSDPTKNPSTFITFIVSSHVWKSVGWGSIIYLAALAGIDQEIYEASYIDGAGRWQRLIHITLPGISTMIAIQLILTMGSLLGSDFEQIYLFTGGQRYIPALTAVSETFDTWVYRNGIASGAFSSAAAVGIFQSVFGAGLILLTNKISKKLGYEGIW